MHSTTSQRSGAGNGVGVGVEEGAMHSTTSQRSGAEDGVGIGRGVAEGGGPSSVRPAVCRRCLGLVNGALLQLKAVDLEAVTS
eukprot:357588-Chlamydomonas_euryale.AAC.3